MSGNLSEDGWAVVYARTRDAREISRDCDEESGDYALEFAAVLWQNVSAIYSDPLAFGVLFFLSSSSTNPYVRKRGNATPYNSAGIKPSGSSLIPARSLLNAGMAPLIAVTLII